MKMALCCDSVLWLCIIVTLLVVGGTTNADSCGSVVSNSSGYTVPSGDIVIEYGKPLDIYCVLNDDFVKNNGPNSSSRLTFVRGNDPFPSEMIDIINSSTIRLHIDKPPLSHIWHTCLLDNKDAVCGNIVFIGTKPKDVKDFKCISNNYENLTCSWTAPYNYVKTAYRLTYHLNGRAGRRHSYDCPSRPKPDSKHRMSCFWNVSTTPQYRQAHEEFFFNLTMNNTFGTNSMITVFNHFQHVLPAPPEHLRVLSNTSSSIYLEWRIPSSLENFPPGLHHRVMYQCEYGPKEWKLAAILCLHNDCTNKIKMHFNVTGLAHAHALCDIRIALRSAKALQDDESMWSANASITARVGSTIPGAPPNSTVGGYEIVSSSNNLQYYGAYVYWKQIPEEIRNGPNFHYNISIDDEPHIRPVEITNAYAKFINLSISRRYTFKIWSENADGRSAEVSELSVPGQFERLKEPFGFTKTAYGGGKYELNWQAPKSLPAGVHVISYTLFWCNHKRDRPYQCNGFLNWTIIPNTVTSKEIYVPEQETYHQFAISATSETSSSGMLWADCTVIHSKNIGKMKNVQINGVGSTYIDVGWKLECSDQIGSVKGYIIYYCPIGSDPTRQICEGPQRNVTFYGDQSLSHGNVTGLEPYTTYMLTVSVLSKNNQESQQSDALRNTTLESAPSTPLDVTIKDITNATMVIEWKPPSATNGILKYYEVHYNNEKRRINDPKATSYILNNLTSYVDYNVSVIACTVACSDPSPPVNRYTLMGYPGTIEELRINMLNESHIELKWDKPDKPGGKNDFYEILFKEKSESKNKTMKMYNSTETIYTSNYCSVEEKRDRIYITVRAVNLIDEKRYEGPWSQESIAYCPGKQSYYMWFIVPLGIMLLLLIVIIAFKKSYDKYEMMKVVGIVLPVGLVGDAATLKATEWTQKHTEPEHQAPADEELLLTRIAKTPSPSEVCGDTSSCVSTTNESITTPSTTPYVLTGEAPKVENGAGYVPFSVSASESVEKNDGGGSGGGGGGYVVAGSLQPPCDSGEDTDQYSSCGGPYVMTGDVAKPPIPNPGYVPFTSASAPEPTEKHTGYVVAGNKGLFIPDLLSRRKSIKED